MVLPFVYSTKLEIKLFLAFPFPINAPYEYFSAELLLLCLVGIK
jgi:hypothetical protein